MVIGLADFMQVGRGGGQRSSPPRRLLRPGARGRSFTELSQTGRIQPSSPAKLVREGAQKNGISPHQTSLSPLLHFYAPPHARSNGTRQPVNAPTHVCIFARTERGTGFTLLHKCASSPERNAATGLHSYTSVHLRSNGTRQPVYASTHVGA